MQSASATPVRVGVRGRGRAFEQQGARDGGGARPGRSPSGGHPPGGQSLPRYQPPSNDARNKSGRGRGTQAPNAAVGLLDPAAKSIVSLLCPTVVLKLLILQIFLPQTSNCRRRKLPQTATLKRAVSLAWMGAGHLCSAGGIDGERTEGRILLDTGNQIDAFSRSLLGKLYTW